jgi:O-antigen/teichoic acid export membrane protein
MDNKALALILAIVILAIFNFLTFVYFSWSYITVPVFKRHKVSQYYYYGFSQLPSEVSSWLIGFFDRVLLNKMQSPAAAGIYGMGHTLGSIPSVMFTSINKAFTPYVFKHYKDAEEGSVESLNEAAAITIKLEGILTAIVVMLIILSNNIVALMEPRYLASSIVMPLVLIAIWIDCNRILFMYPMVYNIKYIKIKSAIWIISAVIDVGLNIYLIPRYSIFGACFATIISFCLSFLLIFYFSNKAMEIKYDKIKLLRILITSFLFSFAYFIGSNIVACGIKILLLGLFFFLMVRILDMYDDIKNIAGRCLNFLSLIKKKSI